MWLVSLGISLAFVVGIFVAYLLTKADFERATGNDYRKPKGTVFPFRKIDRFLTEFDVAIWKMLQREVGNGRVLFAKVRVADLLSLSRKVERRDFYLNLVRSKAVDFVIFDEATLAPVLAIQVGAGDGADDDGIISDVLKSADLPFLQLPHKRQYTPMELNELMREAIKSHRSNRSNDAEEVA